MENQILAEPMVKPDDTVLKHALGKDYDLYKAWVNKLGEKNLCPEWNYYKDTKSWLCKTLNKKKNLCWLSVWNTGLKLTFYFTEKTIEGVYTLDIHNTIKKTAQKTKAAGKLIPIILPVKSKKTLDDGIKLLEYKMTIK